MEKIPDNIGKHRELDYPQKLSKFGRPRSYELVQQQDHHKVNTFQYIVVE